MATPNEKEAKNRKPFFVRLPPAVLDKLKREADRRGVTHTGMVELMIAQTIGSDSAPSAGKSFAETAAGACIAVLDLIKKVDPDPESGEVFRKAANRLEDFLELLAKGGCQ